MATVAVKLATDSCQMATPAHIVEVIPIKAVINCIGRDGDNKCFFRRDESVVEIV